MQTQPFSPTHDEVDAMLRTFEAKQSEMDWAIGEWLIAADELKVHIRFGCANFCEYVGRIFGWNWRQALQRLDTAKRLRGLPALCDRLRDGRLPWSAVREVARVATPETEAEWLQRIEGKTIREIEPMVAGFDEGDRPDKEKDPRKRVKRVILNFTQEKWERFVLGVESERKHCDEFLSQEDAVLASLEEKAAERAGDGSRSRNQVLFTRTLDTGKTYIASETGFALVTEEAAEVLDCDSVQVAVPGEGAAGGKANQTVKPSVRRFCIARAGGRCQVPGCRQIHNLDVHHLVLRKDGGTGAAENLIVLCAYHHRAFHEGWLLVDGSWEKGFRFRHVTGKAYGSGDVPSDLRHAKGVLDLLRRDGYAEHEARAILDEVWPRLEAGDLTLDELDEVAYSVGGPVTIRRYGLPDSAHMGNATEPGAAAHVGSSGAPVDVMQRLDALLREHGIAGSRPAG